MEKKKEKKLFKYLFILLALLIIGSAGYVWVQMHSAVVNPQTGKVSKKILQYQFN